MSGDSPEIISSPAFENLVRLVEHLQSIAESTKFHDTLQLQIGSAKMLIF